VRIIKIDILEETEELIKMLVTATDNATSINRLKRNRNTYSKFGIEFLKTNEIILRSGTTSLFDVQRWAFNVRCSSFKTTYRLWGQIGLYLIFTTPFRKEDL